MNRNDRHADAREGASEVSRRTVLKFAAAAPLLLTFGLAASPLARFLKPTMKPGGFFQEADFPVGTDRIEFNLADFPYDGVCLPFEYRLKFNVFGPQREEIRNIPAFAVRIAPDEIVAFSRFCPRRGCLLSYKTHYCCGCVESTIQDCNCPEKKQGMVMVCPNDHSVFDVTQDGRVLSGPAPRPPRRFKIIRQGDRIAIGEIEFGCIA